MARTFLTLLGTGDYVPVPYELDGKVAEPTRFVQTAELALLNRTDMGCDRVAVLLTERARDTHWESFRRELMALGYPADSISDWHIPDGQNVEELWEAFETIGHATQNSSHLIFDATHGFRSLQLVTLLALTFFRNARDMKIERVLYGAFEVLGPAQTVRERVEANEAIGPAPIFDLTEMLLWPFWAEAVAAWGRTGNAGALLQLSTDPARQHRKHRRGPALWARLSTVCTRSARASPSCTTWPSARALAPCRSPPATPPRREGTRRISRPSGPSRTSWPSRSRTSHSRRAIPIVAIVNI